LPSADGILGQQARINKVAPQRARRGTVQIRGGGFVWNTWVWMWRKKLWK
jgi:hypothetical protein